MSNGHLALSLPIDRTMPLLVVCRCRRLVEHAPCDECAKKIERKRNAAPTRRAHRSPQHARVRTIVFARDPNRCVDCGTTDDLTVDYVTALANGGRMHEDNAVIRCRSHNSSKGARVA